jgi:hypothetical protein
METYRCIIASRFNSKLSCCGRNTQTVFDLESLIACGCGDAPATTAALAKSRFPVNALESRLKLMLIRHETDRTRHISP